MIIYSHLWIVILCSYFVFTNGYMNVRLEDKLCVLDLNYPSITLLDDRDSAAIITQQWNTTLPGLLSNKIRYDCEFKVLSSEDPYRMPRGIYTVITRLKFRQHPITNECMDYIQFRNGNRSPSERICNDISIDGPAGRLIFDQRNRDVTVMIHIDKTRMITEPLELRMVLTAHSECKYSGDFLCDPKEPYSCISGAFVGDNVTNCMYPCRDETSCFHDNVETVPNVTELNDNEIVIENNEFHIDDDNSSCITVKLLEDKLKQNTKEFRALMKENENSLIEQIDNRISDKANTELLLRAIRDSEARLSGRMELLMSDFQKLLLQIGERVEHLERTIQSTLGRGVQ